MRGLRLPHPLQYQGAAPPGPPTIPGGSNFLRTILVYKLSFSLELSIGSVLELLVLKNDADCTSQRLKWTSGGRDMIIVDACTMILVHACTMSTCMYYDHITCIYYDHSTCMYYDHNTCMYYDRVIVASDRAMRRASERANDRATDRAIERSIDKTRK